MSRPRISIHPMTHPLAKLIEMVPEYDEHYPLTLVFDGFADRVADALREGSAPEFVQRAFAFVEALAGRREKAIDDLLIVAFLEAAPWGWLGAAGLLGPEMRRLVRAADPDLIDEALL